MVASDAERMARAGEYVLGRMSDAERERAERDLETDDRFRAAVVAVAERMRYFGSGGGNPTRTAAAEAMWSGLAERLAALPHMQGANLSETLSRQPAPLVLGRPEAGRRDSAAQAEEAPLWRRAPRAFLRLFRRGLRRESAPHAAAVLEAALVGPCAVVEVHARGRLRLLLIGEWALGPNEQLSLWGLRDDGATERIGGFGQNGQVWLGTAGDARHVRFQLGREHISLVPAGRMSSPPLAEGAVRPLAGALSGAQVGSVPDPLAAAGR